MVSELEEKLGSLAYLIDEQELDFEKVDSGTTKIKGKIVFYNDMVYGEQPT